MAAPADDTSPLRPPGAHDLPSELASRLSEATSAEEALGAAASLILGSDAIEDCALYLYRPASGRLELAAGRGGTAASRLPASMSASMEALRSQALRGDESIFPITSAGRALGCIRAISSSGGALEELPRLRLESAAALLSLALRSLALDAERLWALAGAGLGLWQWRMDSGEMLVDERWASFLGTTVEKLGPATIDTWIGDTHPEDLERMEEARREHLAGKTAEFACEARVRHRDGSWVWVLDRGRVVERNESGDPIRMAGTRLDVTERKDLEEALHESITIDKLTGTLNRKAGLEVLEHELRSAARRDSTLSICFLDIDGLMETNDRLGAAAGDTLIVAATHAISSSLRVTDRVCRLGGDEFLAILPDCGEPEAETVGKRLSERLSARMEEGAFLPEGAPPLSISHGFAFSVPGDRPGADELVARADMAMYREKRARRRKRSAPG